MTDATIGNDSYVLPEQMIPADKWTDEYYIRCVRAITNNWNYSVYQYNPNALDVKELGLPLRFADRCFWWSEYYFGRQRNIDYDSVLLRPDGGRRRYKMFRSRDIKKFVDDQVGTLAGTIKDFPDILSAVGVSKNIVSSKQTQLDLEKFLFDSQTGSSLQKIMSPFQAYLQTVNAQKTLESYQQQTSSTNWVESLEDAAVNIGKDFLYRNYWNEQFIEVAKSAYITGLGAAKVNIVNGYPLLEVFPAYEAIVPPRNSGDQHRTDAYGGRVRFMTMPEIIATFPELGPEKLKKIQDMAYNPSQDEWTPYNITYNAGCSVMWWSMRDGVPRVAVADVQWASYAEGEDQKQEQVIRKAKLIGNLYVTGHGLATNQIQDWKNPSHTQLDFLFVRPMSIFGQNMGIPETIYSYVNQIDLWQTKLNEWIANAKGNKYVFYTKNIPEDTTEFVSNLIENGVEFLKGHDIDAGDTTRDKIAEQISFELPQSVIGLMTQIRDYRQMMADILNIPDTTRGQIKGYQPTKNIEASIASASKGTSTFTIPLNTYYLRLIQKAVDKFTVSTLDNKNIEYSLIVGDTQMKQFKATEDFSLSRFGISLKFDDLVDEQDRKEMEGMIFAYAQNSQQTGYTLGDLYTIRSMSTNSEIKSYLEYREAQIKQDRDAERAAALQSQEAQTERMAQAQESQTAVREEGMNNREAANIESKESTEAAKLAAQQVPA